MTNQNPSFNVSIQGRDSEKYRFRVQENTNGKFGPAQEIELPAYLFDGLNAKEVVAKVKQILNEDEPLHEAKEEHSSIYGDKDDLNEVFDEQPRINLPSPKTVLVFTAFAVCGIFLGTLYMGNDSQASEHGSASLEGLTRNELILYYESEIESLRGDREDEYQICKATCDAGRLERDAKVTDLKGKKKLLELGHVFVE